MHILNPKTSLRYFTISISISLVVFYQESVQANWAVKPPARKQASSKDRYEQAGHYTVVELISIYTT